MPNLLITHIHVAYACLICTDNLYNSYDEFLGSSNGRIIVRMLVCIRIQKHWNGRRRDVGRSAAVRAVWVVDIVGLYDWVIGTTAEDVDVAVEAAQNAFYRNAGKDLASAAGAHRAKYLRAIAAKIIERKSELAKLEPIDSGKPLEEAAWDIDDVARCFEYHAELAEALDSKQKTSISLPMETFKYHVLREPLGVTGLITPCTCLELGEVCKEVGLPPGVLNIQTRLGREAGAPLASHPHVDKIAFTGSNATASDQINNVLPIAHVMGTNCLKLT
ncbi:unnamed protein product [Fraxinus pennsylvanica]|uniref:Aldehyde dehydrogenase domain-containing protein n=1 Tax=Fraxinus pennsylvanica TaxID=56036 RepID=A0AAD1YYM4_9LAMI|nr:unnamed protein product [Fraxinus pennsylvanica]